MMYMIPEDDFDTGIEHAMLHVDLGHIYNITNEKRRLSVPYKDRQKIIRKLILLFTGK